MKMIDIDTLQAIEKINPLAAIVWTRWIESGEAKLTKR